MLSTLHCFGPVTVKLQVHIFNIYFSKCLSFLLSIYFTFHGPEHCYFQKFLTVWVWKVNHWLFSVEICYELMKDWHHAYQKCYFCIHLCWLKCFLDQQIFVLYADAVSFSVFVFFWQFHNRNLLTASLIFTSHSKIGIRESQWLWTWCSKISYLSPRDSSISNRPCHQCELLIQRSQRFKHNSSTL